MDTSTLLIAEHKQILDTLYKKVKKKFLEAKNGACPYEEYMYLYQLVKDIKPKNVIELGTGYGLTAVTIALANKNALIHSVDKNESVLQEARQIIDAFVGLEKITLHTSTFLEYLSTIDDCSQDLVFFDGFAPGYRMFLELERVLKTNGVFVCANLQLRGDRRKILLRFADKEYYTRIEERGDTALGIKK